MRAAVLFALALLAAAQLPQAEGAGGPSLARVTASPALAAPNATVTLVATLTNTGAATETFRLGALRLDDGIDWALNTSAAPTLAPGASTTVHVTARTPPEGGTTTITLEACTTSAPSTCASVAWTIRTPISLALSMSPTFTPTQPVFGEARVRWLDGAPVRGAFVEVVEQWAAMGAINSGAEATTDASGRATFVFDSPTARLPGDHFVHGEARHVNASAASHETEYTVS